MKAPALLAIILILLISSSMTNADQLYSYRTIYFTDSGVIGSKEFVIENPEKTVTQSDGRIRKWAKITEVDRYLRVILLEDGVTVHNAFFDRSYKEEKK